VKDILKEMTDKNQKNINISDLVVSDLKDLKSSVKSNLVNQMKSSNKQTIKSHEEKTNNYNVNGLKVKFNVNYVNHKLDNVKVKLNNENKLNKEIILPSINFANKSSNLNHSLMSLSKSSSKQTSSINVLNSSSITKNPKEEAMINNSRRRHLKAKQNKNTNHKLSYMYRVNVSNNVEFDRKSIKPNKSNIEEELEDVYTEDYEVLLNEKNYIKNVKTNEVFSEKNSVNLNEFTKFDNEGYGENVYNTMGVYENLQKEKSNYTKMLDKIGKSSKEVYLLTNI
jgi:hypothetical protein